MHDLGLMSWRKLLGHEKNTNPLLNNICIQTKLAEADFSRFLVSNGYHANLNHVLAWRGLDLTAFWELSMIIKSFRKRDLSTLLDGMWNVVIIFQCLMTALY